MNAIHSKHSELHIADHSLMTEFRSFDNKIPFMQKTNYTVNNKTVVPGSKAHNISNRLQSTVFWLVYSVCITDIQNVLPQSIWHDSLLTLSLVQIEPSVVYIEFSIVCFLFQDISGEINKSIYKIHVLATDEL